MKPEQLQRLEALENDMRLLRASATIPLEIDRAFSDRFGLVNKVSFFTSTKTVASETQAVNEGGTATYSVPKLFDGYFMTETGLHVPYYNLT